jgi:hypothetical protein
MADPRAWILGTSGRDAGLIVFPGLVGVALAWLLREGSPAAHLYAFCAVVLIDSGHVYTTAWRTYLRKEERQSHPIYWVAPLLVLSGVALWVWLRIPYLWAFVVYATAFHHIRQFYGMLRWYQRLNGRRCAPSAFFLYALTLLPLLLFHVRPPGSIQELVYYTNQDLFFAPHSELFHAGMALYGLTACAWLVFELALWSRGVHEPNRCFAVLGPALLYAFCFLWGDSIEEVLFPLLLAHGIPYLAIMSLSLTRLNARVFSTMAKVASLMTLTIAVFGVLEWLYEEHVIEISNAYVDLPVRFGDGFLIMVYLTPLLLHFIFDAYIWTGRHREATVVYALPASGDPLRA